jgi:organic radical activating enzyme
MDKKYFPIKNDPACQLKWTWSTIRLYHATTSSCHRVSSEKFTATNFDQFHNTPKKISEREMMLSGQWPQGGCEYCQHIEQSSGTSDRMLHLSIPNLYPPELDLDPLAVNVTPRIVEVYFDNTCNMSCLYCHDGFSSKIQQENRKFGKFSANGVVIENTHKKTVDYNLLLAKFWDWLQQNKSTVRRLHILGGEPFYQHQFDQCLSWFNDNPCPDLEFNAVSNLMISPDKLEDKILQIKNLLANRKIGRFDITASIDCFGKAQEYVRYGLDLDIWKKNFTRLSQLKWLTLNINQTLSVLTIDTVPDLLDFINQIRQDRKIGHFFSTTVHTHEFLHPKIMGSGFFDKTFDLIISKMQSGSDTSALGIEYMKGIQKDLSRSKKDNIMIDQLGIFLDEIDRRRNLDWKETFPWLVTEVKHVVQ